MYSFIQIQVPLFFRHEHHRLGSVPLHATLQGRFEAEETIRRLRCRVFRELDVLGFLFGGVVIERDVYVAFLGPQEAKASTPAKTIKTILRIFQLSIGARLVRPWIFLL